MIRTGLMLGGLALLAGLCAGPVRELLLASRIGGLAAAWLEVAVLAPILAWVAWRCVPAGLAAPRRAGIAAVALAGTLLGEAALSLAFQATDLAAARTPRAPAEQLPGILMLGWLAVLPMLRR